MVYLLMNKDNEVALFLEKDDEFEEIKRTGNVPIGFTDLTNWVVKRWALRYNTRWRNKMFSLDIYSVKAFIDATHVPSLNDTFWVKREDENITWKDVSLYTKPFSNNIARFALTDDDSDNISVSDISYPELISEGSFPKCFTRETPGNFGSDIFVCKSGDKYQNAMIAPYCELLASEIAAIISPDNHVPYTLETMFDGITVSKCNLFTNEKTGFVSTARLKNMIEKRGLNNATELFSQLNLTKSLQEMLIVDALCFNIDRHRGNYGVLFDNDTLEIKAFAPIFDLNLSLFPFSQIEDFDNINRILRKFGPRIGDDFTLLGYDAIRLGDEDTAKVLRERIESMCDFSFSFRGDDVFTPERIRITERIVRHQAKAILLNERRQSRAVFSKMNFTIA